MKGIKREFSIARTPRENGVAERKNRTLIEVARTMLVDSKLPTTFWAEAVNTACCVLNKALVIKPHNKTPYEVIRGRPPLINFMKPFGCPVIILNTRNSLGKFDEKADERFFVRLDWLFDIDSLTISMNYEPVVAGKQTNGIAETKENIVALDAGKKATKVDESRVSKNDGQDDQVKRSEFEGLLQQERQTEHINSTNSFNTVVLPVNTAGPSFANTALPSHINAAKTPATVEEEVDMNNVVSSYTIPDAPLTKFLKDHPKDQVIDKGKEIIIEPEKPLKKKDQIALDEEVARKLEAEMKAEKDEEESIAKDNNEANRSIIKELDDVQATMMLIGS
nr:ribonuclease H-like domain-containing protein [Tanacetum cinerariifolium]